MLESCCFYSKITDEFKSTNDKILISCGRKKADKSYISPIFQKVKLRLKRKSNFPGESTLLIPEVCFFKAENL